MARGSSPDSDPENSKLGIDPVALRLTTELSVAKYRTQVTCQGETTCFVVSISTKKIKVQFLACTELITHPNVTLCVCFVDIVFIFIQEQSIFEKHLKYVFDFICHICRASTF